MCGELAAQKSEPKARRGNAVWRNGSGPMRFCLAPFIDEDPAIDRATWNAAVIQFKLDLASMRASIEQKITP